MTDPVTLTLAFWAATREEAERQALEWAAKEPRIVRLRSLNVTPNLPQRECWTVVVEPEWVVDGTRLELGL